MLLSSDFLICEDIAVVPNILDHLESNTTTAETIEAVSDCSSDENDENCDGYNSGYDSEELESLLLQKKREISENLNDYKELYKGMTFKDIPEARKVINLHFLGNCRVLRQKKK